MIYSYIIRLKNICFSAWFLPRISSSIWFFFHKWPFFLLLSICLRFLHTSFHKFPQLSISNLYLLLLSVYFQWLTIPRSLPSTFLLYHLLLSGTGWLSKLCFRKRKRKSWKEVPKRKKYKTRYSLINFSVN